MQDPALRRPPPSRHRPRDPGDARAGSGDRLRHQAVRRQVNSALLGGELRTDLPGAPTPGGEGAGKQPSEPSGARARTVYQLTEAGRGALNHWLTSPSEQLYELRDEGMLKLFFSDLADPELASPRRPAHPPDPDRCVRARSRSSSNCGRSSRGPARDRPGPYLTLQLGMGMAEWFIEWSRGSRTPARLRTRKGVGNAEQTRRISACARPPRPVRRGAGSDRRRRARLRRGQAPQPLRSV